MSDAENLRLLAEWLASGHGGEWPQVTSSDLRRIAATLEAMKEALLAWELHDALPKHTWAAYVVQAMKELAAIDPNWRGEGSK